MNIGKRLRKLRARKGMSQRDLEKLTGLKCCYISRVENGFTLPLLKTLEKFARAFEMPLHDLVYKVTYSRSSRFANATPEELHASEDLDTTAPESMEENPPENPPESIEANKLLPTQLTG